MSFLDAMGEAEEPIEIFHIEEGGTEPWRTAVSETTVSEFAEEYPEIIYFVSEEKEVFE